ncbi:STAS/SEC14 domain-containing protein [Hymenobacter caeli]|uniref:STAS/SEC14 domain-containing protein n=1 Tax=Hymenobacter caeli TaxID=2735894 RepID=A0ABX2FPW9_9BACT|nr:STAS/SEC14 domain-containing protein [Hymenobacter caeli]NRT19195.1 hypothetical protein [Hymenobacter caeli]
MLFPLFDALQVQHDAGLRLLRFQWLDLANHRLRPALERGLELVVAHQPTHVLVDFEGLPPIGIKDELWMSTYWFPRIAGQSLRCVALVLRPEHLHNQMTTEAMFWVARHLMRFQVQVFDEVPAALDWLTGRAAAQRLQAEWAAGPPPAPLPT